MMKRYSWSVVHLVAGVIVTLHITETFQARNIEQNGYRSQYRRKREVSCEDKYESITTGHSACLQPSTKVNAAGVDDNNKEVIVDVHNTVRREVSPSASNMMLMSWDDEIANTAQRWAENCYINHDANYKRYAFGRFSVGQNLAWTSSDIGWAAAIDLWANEKNDYSYTLNGSPTGAAVGHYTQMVWAKSIKVGCGYALCDSTHYYVCNYGPAGNGAGKPYVSGSSCADCNSRCDNGLCDCDGRVCLNGGELDLNTCACSCDSSVSFYLQPTCGLNCTDIEDPWQCSQYGVSGCIVYTNVPQECPKMCGWCPTAAYEYEGDDDTSDTVRPVWSVLGLLAVIIRMTIV